MKNSLKGVLVSGGTSLFAYALMILICLRSHEKPMSAFVYANSGSFMPLFNLQNVLTGSPYFILMARMHRCRIKATVIVMYENSSKHNTYLLVLSCDSLLDSCFLCRCRSCLQQYCSPMIIRIHLLLETHSLQPKYEIRNTKYENFICLYYMLHVYET